MQVVTGCAGFIGSNLTDTLINQGFEVLGIDNLHTGSMDNISTLKSNKNFVFTKANSGEIEKIIKVNSKDVETIFHNGIYSSSPMYKENPLLVSRAMEDFISILEFIRKKDCKLVFASSSSLYNGLQPPHKEDMHILVTDFYTEARMTMERLAELYHKIYGIKIIALRYFSVYGPKEKSKGRYANLISQFLWAMMKNEQPLLYGDGMQTRDFVYVDDVVQANLAAMKFNGKFEVFNVGTGKSESLKNLIELLNEKLRKKIEPKYIDNKIKNYVQHTLAETKKSKKMLGFEARISLEEGIDKLIEYYRT